MFGEGSKDRLSLFFRPRRKVGQWAKPTSREREEGAADWAPWTGSNATWAATVARREGRRRRLDRTAHRRKPAAARKRRREHRARGAQAVPSIARMRRARDSGHARRDGRPRGPRRRARRGGVPGRFSRAQGGATIRGVRYEETDGGAWPSAAQAWRAAAVRRGGKKGSKLEEKEAGTTNRR